jgi:flagellar biosynthesis/type III secretory pathway M-ring protein FliF/YscJ
MEENGNGIDMTMIFKIIKIALYPIVGIVGFILGIFVPKIRRKLREKKAERLEKKAADAKLAAAKDGSEKESKKKDK